MAFSATDFVYNTINILTIVVFSISENDPLYIYILSGPHSKGPPCFYSSPEPSNRSSGMCFNLTIIITILLVSFDVKLSRLSTQYDLQIYHGTLLLHTWLLDAVVDDDIILEVPTGSLHRSQRSFSNVIGRFQLVATSTTQCHLILNTAPLSTKRNPTKNVRP